MKYTQHEEWSNEPRAASTSPGEDTSVSFSVDAPSLDTPAITEDAAVTTPPAARAASEECDACDASSGQIDLTALKAGEEGARPQVLDLLPIFPFGEPPASAPVPEAPALDVPARAWRARSIAVLLAGAAAIAALTAGISAPDAAATGPRAAAGLAAAARAVEARLPRVEAPAERAPVAPPAERSSSGDAPDGVAASQRAPEHRVRATGAAAPARAKPAPAAPNTTDRRAPTDPCRGDLLCAMRRATGG
ncbi:putative membrane protein [Sorangium cellulosum So ce56]|uniref:Membrane protein n=1 Tax=Sorangium cellulosum (strain So ce56) TaxID=448385 RepID=A9GIY2_SORC5|nr:hypothetical protein [Sorangium cellulosum]CAN93329.1 putative membrane protein [Sorangium cellulosum So ce56]